MTGRTVISSELDPPRLLASTRQTTGRLIQDGAGNFPGGGGRELGPVPPDADRHRAGDLPGSGGILPNCRPRRLNLQPERGRGHVRPLALAWPGPGERRWWR